MTAVISIILPSISYFMKTLFIASISNQIVSVNRKTMDVIEPIISDLCHPNVYDDDDPFRVKASAIILITNASKSDAKCAQSVAIAIEPAKYAPVPYAPTNTSPTIVTHLS